MAGEVTAIALDVFTNAIVSAIPNWYLAWGSGTTLPTRQDVVLASPSPEPRVTATVSRVTITFTNDAIKLVGNITAAVAGARSEIGVFTAPSGGFLIARGVHSPINVPVGEFISYTIVLQQV